MNLQLVSVRTKLALGFGLFTALFVAVAAMAVLRMQQENDRFTHYVTVDEARVKLAREVLEATQRRAIAARNLLLVKDDAQAQQERADVESAHREVKLRLAELKTIASKNKVFKSFIFCSSFSR